MEVISTTIEYQGLPIKIENGRVFLPAFGTTIQNHSMHSSWVEVDVNILKPDLRSFLKERGLI